MFGFPNESNKHIPYFAAEDLTKKWEGIPSRRRKRIGKITQNSQLIKLIDSAFENDKLNKSKIDEEITAEELLEFIFKTQGKFLEEAAQELGFKCLEFLKEIGLNFNNLEKIFEEKSSISTALVLQLNQSQLPLKEKRRMLSMIFDLNEKGVKEIVKNIGSKETKEILAKIERRVAKERKWEEDYEDSSSEDFEADEEGVIPQIISTADRERKMKIYAPLK